MRIFTKLFDGIREVERDLFEMGVDVHPQTMQDKVVAADADFSTKELFGYAFQYVGPCPTEEEEAKIIRYLFRKPEAADEVLAYIKAEIVDRTQVTRALRAEDEKAVEYIEQMNPGNAYKTRLSVWDQFLRDGKFAYTYAERFAPQLAGVIRQLEVNPDTRQAVVSIHSNISPDALQMVAPSYDYFGMGGLHRIPCSLHYQFLRRNGGLDMIYSMRSCDFLTHFAVDILLALRMKEYIRGELQIQNPTGRLVYMAGSLHAYAKDIAAREIF